MEGVQPNLSKFDFHFSVLRKRRKIRLESGLAAWTARMEEVVSTPVPPRDPKPDFVAKCKNVKFLDDYTRPASQEFWDSFPCDKDLDSGPPFVLKPGKFLEWAEQLGSVQLRK